MRLNKLAKPQVRKYENSGIIPNDALNLTKSETSVVPSDAYNADKVAQTKVKPSNTQMIGAANSAVGAIAPTQDYDTGQQIMSNVPVYGQFMAAGSNYSGKVAEGLKDKNKYGVSQASGRDNEWGSGVAGSTNPLGAIDAFSDKRFTKGEAILGVFTGGISHGILKDRKDQADAKKVEAAAIREEERVKQETLKEQARQGQANLTDASNRGFTTSGNTQSSFYGKNGGLLKSIKYLKGGELKPNKSEMTKLSEGQELAYKNWMSKNKYNESGDYDLRDYYKNEGYKNLGSPKTGEHFIDKFKKLAPFSEGDGYMQLSEESKYSNNDNYMNMGIKNANNTSFDKRGQGTWIGDKFVAYKQGGVIKKDGGELQPVSKNTQLAVGQSHENGGIKLDSKSEIEGGETLVDKGDHTLVVSDNLVNPLSGNTFAKDDLKLAKTLGRFEGKTSNLAKNSIKQINAKREVLHDMQQKMNGDATDNETLEAKNGMKLNKVGIAGQGNTSEDITYKADIPIAGRPSPIRFAPKEVKKLNMLSKPVQYPVPLKPQVPNYAENGMKMYKNGGEYTEDKKGYKSLVKKDGTYAQLPDGRTRYKAKGSTTWKDITDSKSLSTIESIEPRFKSDPNKNYDSFLQGKFNSNDLQGGQHYYKDAKSGKIIRVPRGGPNKDVELELNDLEAKEVDKVYFGGKYFAPKPPNKDFTPSDPANLFGSKPPLQRFKKEDTSVNPTSPDKLPAPYKAPPFTMPDKKKARLAKEEPRDYSSLKSGVSSLAKGITYTAPALMDYANQQKNIARLKGITIPDAPQQGFVNLAKQNMEVDKADIRKQQANYNAGLSGTLADSQTAALMKANVAEQSANALSRVNQTQRNANIQTANAQTEMNLGIDARNRAGKYGQAQQQMEKDVDISNRTADVKSKLISDFRNVQNTYRQEKYADATLDVDLAGMSPEARAEFDRSTKARGHYGRYIVRNGGKLSNLTKSRI